MNTLSSRYAGQDRLPMPKKVSGATVILIALILGLLLAFVLPNIIKQQRAEAADKFIKTTINDFCKTTADNLPKP